MGWRSLGDSNPCFRRERANFSSRLRSPHSLQHVLDRAFGLRELMCIVGAQHHIRVGPVLRWLPASLMNQSYGLLRAAFDGIFAIGDVRSGSIKRVAAAVGERARKWSQRCIPLWPRWRARYRVSQLRSVADGQAFSKFVPHAPQALGSNARICAAIRGECSFPVPLPPPPS